MLLFPKLFTVISTAKIMIKWINPNKKNTVINIDGVPNEARSMI